MSPVIDRGFLVLADISGFTAFVTATELRHGPAIIAELLEAVIGRLAPPLEVQEVEGDAVFALGPEPSITPPAALLDVLDDAFIAFRARRGEMTADQSCSCGVCRSVARLDLKIVAHHGVFVRQVVGGRGQVAGTDVILAHRLLKNGLADTPAYLLLTEAAVDYMRVTPSEIGLVARTERYEHLGEVRCFVTEPQFMAQLGQSADDLGHFTR